MWQAIDDPQDCRAVYVIEDELHQIPSDLEGFTRWLFTWASVTPDDDTKLTLCDLRKRLERSLRLREISSVTWPTAETKWEIAS